MSKEDIKNKHLALKNSGDIEYDADIILYLLKSKENQYKRVVKCDKNRQTGDEFILDLYINKNTLDFDDSEPQQAIEMAVI